MPQSQEQIKKKTKKITFGVLAAIAFFLLIVFIFWRITDEVVLEKETGLDSSVHQFLSNYTTPATTKLMLLFTLFGSTGILLPAYILLAAFFLFYKKNTVLTIGIAAIGLVSRGVLYILKNIFHRTRPLQPLAENITGYSYPSGHSFSTFTFFGLLTYLVWKANISRWWKWILSVIFFLLAACVALSRVYLHAHFASDVIAGFCLSVIWLTISLSVLNLYCENDRRQKETAL